MSRALREAIANLVAQEEAVRNPDAGLRLRLNRSADDLVRDFVRLETTLPDWTFVSVGHQFPDDACTGRLLAPMLEGRVRACRGESCRTLNGLLFRSDIARAIERDEGLTPVERYALRVTGTDGGVRVQVTSPTEDGGLHLHTDTTRIDALSEVMLEQEDLGLPAISSDAATTFGAAGLGRTWRTSEPIDAGAALAACAGGTLEPVGRFLGLRAVWQDFPEGWTRQFEYQLPCAAAFVVPAHESVRPGPWSSFPLGPRGPPDRRDPGPPYVNGSRVRRFGAVRYLETVEDPVEAPYGKRCLIEATVGGTTRATALSSSYGCQVQFVADFNADGLADFVVHQGGESCEHSVLYLSTPQGWVDVGRQGSCE
ncbi:MAG: hypothetical protein SFW67_18710 [Myxococcaceae bacterium]|nr:hypothetical protein [Myxococcaceae bacterium]